MQLVLGAVVIFIGIGLSSRRFGWRQQVLITLVALALAVIQFMVPHYL